MIIALIWGTPIAVCLVMALGSLVSRTFRQFCSDQLFGTSHAPVRSIKLVPALQIRAGALLMEAEMRQAPPNKAVNQSRSASNDLQQNVAFAIAIDG